MGPPVRVAQLALVMLACGGCLVVTTQRESRSMPEPAQAVQLDAGLGEFVGYRILSKGDFRASGSGTLWGNVAHGAEICVAIVPVEGDEPGVFRAVMQRECSFWNKLIGPAGTLLRLGGAVAGVPVLAPSKQPDGYILQHEQIHFAITEVAALKLSRRAARPESQESDDLRARLYVGARERMMTRHAEFDGDTSGTFDPRNLEKWVRVLEIQLERLCGPERDCPVRISE